MSRALHVANAALLVPLFAGSLWAYPALPERIPRRFSLGGEANAYWAAALVALLGVTAWVAVRLPAWIEERPGAS
jgi:uncharacterized membrane protein